MDRDARLFSNRLVLTFSLVLILANCCAQAPAIPPHTSGKKQVFTYVEQMPTFPGGENALYTFLSKNTRYPKKAIAQQIEGTVYLQFVVDSAGSISDIKVMRSTSELLTKEAVRVVKKLPDFIPGRQNGKAVAVYYTLPIKFKLNE